MEFLSIQKYCKLKGISRNALYLAIKRGDVIINRESGNPVIFLSQVNLNYKPSKIYQKNGRKKKTKTGN